MKTYIINNTILTAAQIAQAIQSAKAGETKFQQAYSALPIQKSAQSLPSILTACSNTNAQNCGLRFMLTVVKLQLSTRLSLMSF